MSPLYWPNCDNDNWELMAITMISEEKKGNRIPTNEFCCISIGLISLFIRYQLLFFCSIQFYPEWTRYERQHERHCAYRLESRQRTRFLNFSWTILPKKNISFTNGQPLKIRFPKWTSPVWCVSRWIKALRWSWLFVFFSFLLKKIDHKKGIFLIILTLTAIHPMQIRRWGNINIRKLTCNIFTIHDINIDIM